MCLCFTIGYYMCNMALAGCASAVVHAFVDIAALQISLYHCLCSTISLPSSSKLSLHLTFSTHPYPTCLLASFSMIVFFYLSVPLFHFVLCNSFYITTWLIVTIRNVGSVELLSVIIFLYYHFNFELYLLVII